MVEIDKESEIKFDQESLRRHVIFLADLAPARNYRHIQSLNIASGYIKQELLRYGYSPRQQSFELHGHHYRNIIASWGAADRPVFVVGAHYDVCGDQPGADDNGSGIASLLELAKYIAEIDQKLPYRIDFVAYSLEEPPFFKTAMMGSYIHARSLQKQKENVIGMVSLEMLGYFSERAGSQRYPFFLMKLVYPSKGNFIGVVSNLGSRRLVNHFHQQMSRAPIAVEKLTAPRLLTGVDFSDHANYWAFGYPAVMVTDTAFYRNPHYHQISDTVETLDFEKMSAVTTGLYYAITTLGSN